MPGRDAVRRSDNKFATPRQRLPARWTTDCLVTPEVATRDARPRLILRCVQAWMAKL